MIIRGDSDLPRFPEAPIRYSCTAHGIHPTNMRSFLRQHRKYLTNSSQCTIHITVLPNATPNGILTTTGRWSGLPGHTLNHGHTQKPQLIKAADITVKSLYWRIVEKRFEPPSSMLKWEVTSTPWSRTKTLLPTMDFWNTILDTDLPKSVFNTNYELGHYLIPIRHAGEGRQMCRHCSQNTATPMLETPEHIVLHCDAIGKKLWPTVWSTLAQLGCNPTTSDDGTLILSLGLAPKSAAATVLAFTRHTIISFHTTRSKYSTHYWPEIGLSDLEAALKKHVYQQFFYAGRKTSKPNADLRRRNFFDNTWTKTSDQLGILHTDWKSNRLTWTWKFT